MGIPKCDDTVDENAVAPSCAFASADTVVRDCGARFRPCVAARPDSVKYVIVTGTCVAVGLASSRSVSKNVPVDPSAN
jgi:hypothetical protein